MSEAAKERWVEMEVASGCSWYRRSAGHESKKWKMCSTTVPGCGITSVPMVSAFAVGGTRCGLHTTEPDFHALDYTRR
jgi:hypothetical protein